MRFFVGQRWISADGARHGTVTEISDDGRSGVVVIEDTMEHYVDVFRGAVAALQSADNWRVVAQA
ncbi:MAG TPA: hypothetical protein VKI44_27810 [Acetobacteraceae bacterium]|nr:hypothetical protein [Acetobacteraceae bacterium]